ncbi:hypothetical protein [Mycobacteroides abscessus]|uniref:hypothetical protein n=1 Tax=Mycobacteroides abscessus TaxID=36809 RepID=UPI000C267097|nr:hypothetical protein [Mycobacteroides abscessus]MBN7374084.1 hypothetical protein [Mycobacteroides abscessus subsp. abscessus]RIR16492.1 hypothetical protein D2E41_26595 [Mycobacteroides abscessus]
MISTPQDVTEPLLAAAWELAMASIPPIGRITRRRIQSLAKRYWDQLSDDERKTVWGTLKRHGYSYGGDSRKRWIPLANFIIHEIDKIGLLAEAESWPGKKTTTVTNGLPGLGRRH